MTLLVTVPHYCVVPRTRDPGCDANAMAFAIAIQSAIERPTLLFPGDTARSKCDLNRKACRHRPMRLRLADMMLDKSSASLIDVHTFDFGRFPMPGGKTLWFVVMSGEKTASALKLLLCMRRHGFGNLVRFGMSPKNDIVEQSNNMGLPAALLEIRSDLATCPHYEKIVRKLTNAIEDWVRGNIR